MKVVRYGNALTAPCHQIKQEKEDHEKIDSRVTARPPLRFKCNHIHLQGDPGRADRFW